MRVSTLHSLLALAVAAQAAPTRGGSEFANLKAHIKNVVILVMENRSLDNLLGGQKLKGLDNPIQKGPFCNPYNLTNPAAGSVCSAANDFDSITDDPDHAVYGNNIEFYGTFTPDNNAIASGHLTPTQKGFVHEQLRLYSSKANRSTLAQQVMNYYTEEQVPVLTALVKNFVTFNHWHSAIPGVSCVPGPLSPLSTVYRHADDGCHTRSPPTPTVWPLFRAAPMVTAPTTPPSRPRASTRSPSFSR
jgi:phospholipase C